MSLKEQSYSVLIISAAEGFSSAVRSVLPENSFDPVHNAENVSRAKRMLAERDYDLVIINSPLPDDVGVNLSIDICSDSNSAVLLFIRAEHFEEITDKVSRYGVFTLSKPATKLLLTTAIGWMTSVRERLRKSEKKAMTLEEKMAEIRLVNRAKWLLIDKKKIDEPEAHRYIEKEAMNRCVTKVQIAREIIDSYD